MKLSLINHNYRYELEKLIRIFLPFEKIEFYENMQTDDGSAVAQLEGNVAIGKLYLNGKVFQSSATVNMAASNIKNEIELKLATSLYDCFKEASGYIPEWGILTGIRPAKLYSRLVSEMGENKADAYFSNVFKVSDKKLFLCKETHLSEERIVSLSDNNSYSLYISIPFCPTRCSYCSFVSHSVESAKKLIPKYIDNLCEELITTSKIANDLNLRLTTVYIGGGTPTSIDAEYLKTVMETVYQYFDLSQVLEYTVEAGRPDTVTEEKLKVIKNFGATRISINPQTMNDNVLKEIGRKHTAGDTVKAFNLARLLGFNNINMDLIAGLPTDTFGSFKSTVREILRLNPESVTVHSLSMKRASSLTKNGCFPETAIGIEAAKMVDYAHDILAENEIFPYYMYRQSKTVGNLENVGYSKRGYECLYNVFIMDETHTILACGASAVTKLREPNGDYIERIFNFKYPYEYIDRFNELLERKSAITQFYNKFKK